MKLILLWITALSVMLYAMSIDSLSILALILWGVGNFAFICICYYFLSEDDVVKYSGASLIDKILGMNEEDYK